MARKILLLLLCVASVLAPWTVEGHGKHGSRSARSVQEMEQLVVDSLLDNILMTVQRELGDAGFDTTVLPDVAQDTNGLALTATEGMMRSLSSIYRSSSAVMEYGEGNVFLKTNLSLATLEIGYHVKAKYNFLSISSDVGATVRRSGVYLKAGIFYTGNVCYVGVVDVDVYLLDGIDWRVTGFGIINKIVSSAIGLIFTPAKIKGLLKTALGDAVKTFSSPCHNYIPGLNAGMDWKC